MPLQVRYREAQRFRAAAAAAPGKPSASDVDADRTYQRLISEPGAQIGNTNPMLRYITDAAPQRGEVAMRSGLPPPGEDPADRQFMVRAAGNVVN